MKESKRQRQIGLMIQKELNSIFQKLGLGMIDQALISISGVKMTPDLLEARAYISIYNAKEEEAVLEKLHEKHGQIKYELGNQLRHHLRRIPVLVFFKDDTLEYADKMEKVFDKIKEEDEKIKKNINK